MENWRASLFHTNLKHTSTSRTDSQARLKSCSLSSTYALVEFVLFADAGRALRSIRKRGLLIDGEEIKVTVCLSPTVTSYFNLASFSLDFLRSSTQIAHHKLVKKIPYISNRGRSYGQDSRPNSRSSWFGSDRPERERDRGGRRWDRSFDRMRVPVSSYRTVPDDRYYDDYPYIPPRREYGT